MKKREPVSHIMTKNVKTVPESGDLHEVMRLMRNNHVRHIPVVKGDKVVGIISKTDISRLTFGNFFEGQDDVDEGVLTMLTIPQVMRGDIRTINSKETIHDVAEILVESEYHALPVEEDGHIVGIVTTTDLIKYLLEQY